MAIENQLLLMLSWYLRTPLAERRKQKPPKIIATVHDSNVLREQMQEVHKVLVEHAGDWWSYDLRDMPPHEQNWVFKHYAEDSRPAILFVDPDPFHSIPKVLRNKSTKLDIGKPKARVAAGNKPEDGAGTSNLPSGLINGPPGVSKSKFLSDMLKSQPEVEKTAKEKQKERLAKLLEACKVPLPEYPTHVLTDRKHPEYSETWKHYSELLDVAQAQVATNIQTKLNRMPTCYKCHQPMKLYINSSLDLGYTFPVWHCENDC